MEDLTSPGVLADTGRVYANPSGSLDPQQRVRAARCRTVRGMKRELGHEVLLSSGRFRSAITAIVAIAERQLLERTWRDRGGGEGLADVGTIAVFASIPN